jgi:hypothetical protein
MQPASMNGVLENRRRVYASVRRVVSACKSDVHAVLDFARATASGDSAWRARIRCEHVFALLGTCPRFPLVIRSQGTPSTTKPV